MIHPTAPYSMLTTLRERLTRAFTTAPLTHDQRRVAAMADDRRPAVYTASLGFHRHW